MTNDSQDMLDPLRSKLRALAAQLDDATAAALSRKKSA
jgi:hypothetical protein